MKLKSYRFKSYEEIAEVASSVLTYYTSTISPSDIQYNPIADYKNIQLFKLLDGRYNAIFIMSKRIRRPKRY